MVFSKTLKTASWGKWDAPQIIATNTIEAVKTLKRQAGEDIVLWGSLSLAQSLLQASLVDEVHLRVCAVALGKGKKLFSNDTTFDFRLAETKKYQSGRGVATH